MKRCRLLWFGRGGSGWVLSVIKVVLMRVMIF